MSNKLDFEKFRPLFGEWADDLKPVFESEDMFNLYQEFKELTTRGHQITPKSENLYKFLSSVAPSNLKLLVIGMDSYPAMYYNKTLQATGIAFDCSNSPDGKCQPSLLKLYEGVGDELGKKIEPVPNLNYLTDQGVMLANRALNCKLFKTGSYIGRWDFFWEYFLEEIMAKKHIGVPILLLGKDADKLRRYIFEMANPVYKLEHPSYAARTSIPWDTKGVFTQINNRIETNFGEVNKIIWDKKKFDELINSCPF